MIFIPIIITQTAFYYFILLHFEHFEL